MKTLILLAVLVAMAPVAEASNIPVIKVPSLREVFDKVVEEVDCQLNVEIGDAPGGNLACLP